MFVNTVNIKRPRSATFNPAFVQNFFHLMLWFVLLVFVVIQTLKSKSYLYCRILLHWRFMWLYTLQNNVNVYWLKMRFTDTAYTFPVSVKNYCSISLLYIDMLRRFFSKHVSIYCPVRMPNTNVSLCLVATVGCSCQQLSVDARIRAFCKVAQKSEPSS